MKIVRDVPKYIALEWREKVGKSQLKKIANLGCHVITKSKFSYLEVS